jgi:hypothetical protein
LNTPIKGRVKPITNFKKKGKKERKKKEIKKKEMPYLLTVWCGLNQAQISKSHYNG